LAVASVHVESYGRVDLCGGEIRWSIEVDVEWKVELVLEGIHFESTKRLVGCDLGTLAFPSGRGLEVGSGLLESVEKESGAAVIDAVIGDGVDDLLNAGLHGVHVVENRHLEVRAGLAVQTRVRSLHAASASVEVEVAITLIAKSGRTAVDAIFLEMVASTVWHGSLSKYGLSAVSHQLSAKGQQQVDTGRRYAFGKVEQCPNGGTSHG
jgi:hypothetical protein